MKLGHVFVWNVFLHAARVTPWYSQARRRIANCPEGEKTRLKPTSTKGRHRRVQKARKKRKDKASNTQQIWLQHADSHVKLGHESTDLPKETCDASDALISVC